MKKIVLLRHGESTWNRENRFTGWTDVPLSETGVQEARQAGRLLREGGFTFDMAFTSVLKRAIKTLWLVLEEMDLMWIPVTKSWRLNERHYGALQGLNKSEAAAELGEAQVKLWRRSFDVPPRRSPRTTRDIPVMTPDMPLCIPVISLPPSVSKTPLTVSSPGRRKTSAPPFDQGPRCSSLLTAIPCEG